MSEPSPRPAKAPLRWYQYRLRTFLVFLALCAVWLGMISRRARQQRTAVEKIKALGGTVVYDYAKARGGRWNEFDPKNSAAGPAWLRSFIGEDYFQTVVQVNLSKVKVSDDDLAILENLPDVESVDLSGTEISNDGLVHVEGMRKLKGLFLWKTLIDDRGLAHLRNLTDLRLLILDGTTVTDAGMENLQGLTNLEDWLGLTDTQMSDEGLKYFKGFKKLKEINLLRTKVTEHGAEELKSSLPNLRISYSQDGKDRTL